MSRPKFSESATRYVLEALIPYTEANMLLTFKPNKFFNELEKRDNRGGQTYRRAFAHAKNRDLIRDDANGTPRLTDKGQRRIQPFIAKKLGKGAKLMIIFDIPENERSKRSHIRLLLGELSFKQIQKSVWVSSYDHTRYLKAEIKRLNLENSVRLFESSEL